MGTQVLLGVPARHRDPAFRPDGHRRPQQAFHRQGQHGFSAPGRPGRHPRGADPENAAAHPRYRYFAETGEERYASFLGAPIIHHRRVMGCWWCSRRSAASSTKARKPRHHERPARRGHRACRGDRFDPRPGQSSARASRKPSPSACPAPPGSGWARRCVAAGRPEVVPDKQVDDIDAEIALSSSRP